MSLLREKKGEMWTRIEQRRAKAMIGWMDFATSWGWVSSSRPSVGQLANGRSGDEHNN